MSIGGNDSEYVREGKKEKRALFDDGEGPSLMEHFLSPILLRGRSFPFLVECLGRDREALIFSFSTLWSGKGRRVGFWQMDREITEGHTSLELVFLAPGEVAFSFRLLPFKG